jgi:ADP-ribose pyrophosphatase
MAEDSGTWKTFGTRTIYDNRWVRLDLVEVQAPNGERWEHHVVHLDRVAIAMLLNERGEVLMLHRYRFAIDKWGYELLGGIVEDGEEPAATAKREALEESGWRPLGDPTHLASFEPMPGMMTAQTDVFMWQGAEHVGDPTDTEEAGRLEWVPLSRLRTLLEDGQLLGGGTIIAVQAFLLSRAADPTRED